jgi:starch phosphorylase
MGTQLVNWQHTLEQKWAALRFGAVKVKSDEVSHIFEVEIYLGGLDPNSVRVELYADGVNGGESIRQEMKLGRQLSDANGYLYAAQVPAARSAADYTARVIPQHDGVAIPLENARILWQR